jgi:hypothetical protein
MTSPITLLRESIRAVPAVKYALGVAGIASAIAIIKALGLDYRVAVIGTVVMLVLMTVLVVFARLSTLGGPDFRLPALVFTWFSLLLVIAISIAMFSSVFFRWPINLQSWVSAGDTGATPPAPSPQQDKPLPRAKSEASAPPPQEARKPAPEAGPRTEPIKPAAKPVQKPAETRETSAVFNQLQGQWKYVEHGEREVFYQPGTLGRCVLKADAHLVMRFTDVDRVANEIRGTFQSAQHLVAAFSPPGGYVPSEVPLAECQRRVTGDQSKNETSIRRQGRVILEVGPGRTPRITPTLVTSDCEQDGATCSGGLFGERELPRLEIVGPDLFKIREQVYRRQ